jgi:hypothetical protein
MKDSEVGITVGVGVFVLAFGLILTFSGLASDRLRYDTFLRAQAASLACRAEHPNQPDKLCGPVPTYQEFTTK